VCHPVGPFWFVPVLGGSAGFSKFCYGDNGMAPTLSGSAMRTAALMEVGWELHMNDNSAKPPAIWKTQREGNTTHVDSCRVSHDDILELQQAGLLERIRQLGVGHETVTIFRYAG